MLHVCICACRLLHVCMLMRGVCFHIVHAPRAGLSARRPHGAGPMLRRLPPLVQAGIATILLAPGMNEHSIVSVLIFVWYVVARARHLAAWIRAGGMRRTSNRSRTREAGSRTWSGEGGAPHSDFESLEDEELLLLLDFFFFFFFLSAFFFSFFGFSSSASFFFFSSAFFFFFS